MEDRKINVLLLVHAEHVSGAEQVAGLQVGTQALGSGRAQAQLGAAVRGCAAYRKAPKIQFSFSFTQGFSSSEAYDGHPA